MLNNIKKRRSEGFTIIEVMIVLAIAGLIMLIVFLAVPALQRNAHNTSIKNDVASLLGGMTEYTNNNNGVPPTALSGQTTTSVNIGAATSNTSKVKVGYIDGTTITTITVATGPVTNAQAAGTIRLYTKASCNSNGKDLVVGDSSRNYAALYGLEGGAKICQES
jgi:prepilin-type N-terminal cleavage/methylation domain-containing protein